MKRRVVRSERRGTSTWVGVGAMWLALAAGCGDDDGGGGDAGATPIPTGGVDGGAAPDPDGGVDGGLTSRFPEPESCDPCDAPLACVRGACVDLCGADATTVEASLAEGVVPIAGYCRTAQAFDPGGDTSVIDLRVEDDGETITATAARFALVPGNVEPTAQPVGSADVTPAVEGVPLFWSVFAAEAPGGDRVAVGYTQDFGDGRLIVLGGGVPIELSAPNNFDAAWLDADTLLVNGQGLVPDSPVAQGLYAAVLGEGGAVTPRQLVAQGLAFSGSVELLGDLVLYGGFDGDFANQLLVVDRAALEAVLDDPAAPPLDATSSPAVVAAADGASSFDHLGGGRLAVRRFNAELESLFTLVETSGETAETFALGTPVPLAGPSGEDPDVYEQIIDDVVATGDPDRVLLVHDAGLLLVDVGDL